MTSDQNLLKLDGIYRQRQDNYYLQRVKLAAGVISAGQVRCVADLAERYGQSAVHLTTRGSMEIHWLQKEDLPGIKCALAATGLTSRGACGGAVRGVSCGSRGTHGFHLIQSLACRIHRHFTGNPHFENLPKKFKIGIESDIHGKRHLIQDAGLVLVRSEEGRAWYDVWIAGGLGREPQAGFLLEKCVAGERIIPLIEAVLRVYAAGVPAGKRLKHLVRDIGQDELCRRIATDRSARGELPPAGELPESLHSSSDPPPILMEVPIFAGEISSSALRSLALFADAAAGGMMAVTANQDIAFELAAGIEPEEAREKLEQAGFSTVSRRALTSFRICPGNHECLMGLVPTRTIAGSLLNVMGAEAGRLTWAISGCPNSCTQPQLADVGIVAARLAADDDGQCTPRFDIYRSEGNGLGRKTGESLTMEVLIAEVQRLV